MKSLLFILFFIVSGLSAKAQFTITYILNAEKGKDVIVDSGDPNMNYNFYPLNFAAAWTTSGSFFIVRSLMDFEIKGIPSNATVTDARLDLYFATIGWFGSQQYGDNEAYLQKITQAWDETTVNWNNQPGISSQNQVSLQTSNSAIQDYTNIDVTALVQDMVSKPDSAFGFLLRVQDESVYRSITFASGDNSNFALHPRLTVTYYTCLAPPAGYTWENTSMTVHFMDTTQGSLSWFWDFGDGTYSFLKSPYHTFQLSGNYTICESVSGNCGSETICKNILLDNTGQDEFNNDNIPILVYPNPFTDKFYLDIKTSNYYSLQVFLPDSRKLFEENIYLFKGETYPFPLDQLSNGIYYLIIQSKSGRYTYPVIKQ